MIMQDTQTFAEITTPVNPFPGLRPFEFDESHLFFGRDGQSEQLIAKLGHKRFLAVVGTSGSGKSSLVRAGLLPTLLGGFLTGAGSDWRIAIMRPGNDPVGNLAQALNTPDVFGSEFAENAAIQTALTEATLRRGGLGLVDAVRQTLMPESENLLVVVDQFEEIFRFARVSQGKEYQNEAAAFVKLILEASRQRELPIYVVMTMRSDYLGDCSQFWDLPEAINDSQYLIPRLTRDQLREAITGPVAVGAGRITSRLVNRLLNDIGDNQDQLPILQHALMRGWDEWKSKSHDHIATPNGQPDGGAIDLCCYESIGGMAEALSRHADEAFNELPGPRRKLAERMFKALTEKGEDNREIRRPLPLREIRAITEAGEKEIIAVIETFRLPGRSFLTPPAETALTADSLIDISHESLIRNWKRLREWVENEARHARAYRRLAETAALYQTGEAGLWRDPDLQVALNWRRQVEPNEAWARRYHPAFTAALDFLQASKQKQDEEIADQERQQRAEIERAQRELEQAQALAEAQQDRAEAEKRRAMEEERRANAERQKAEESQRRIEEQAKAASRLRRMVAALILVSAIAFVVAAAALYLWQKARNAEQKALDAKVVADAESMKAKRLADDLKLNVVKLADTNKGMLMAQYIANEERRRAEDSRRKAEAQARIAAEKEVEAIKDRNRAEVAAEDAKRARKDAEEKQYRAEAAEKDSKDSLMKMEFFLRELEAANQKIATRQKITDSRLLAKAAVDEAAGGTNPTRGVLLAMHSISRLLDNKATKYNLKDFEDGLEALRQSIQESFLRQRFQENGRGMLGHVESVAFTPEGKIVAASRHGHMSGAPTVTIRHPSSEMYSELNNEGMVLNWTPGQRFTLRPDENRLANSIAVSPDGAYFAIGQDDGKIKALDISSEGRPAVETRAHRHPINLITLSNRRTHDTKGQQTLVANASVFWSSSVTDLNRQKVDRLWRKPTLAGWGRIVFGIARSNHLVRAINFSLDGSLVAISRQDGVIELRDSQKDGRIYLKWVSDDNDHEPVLGLAFSPLHGRGADRLVTVTRTGIKIWDISQLKKRKYGMFEDRNDAPPKIVSETMFGRDLGDAAGGVAYSPDGRLIATSANNGAVMIWDVSKEDGASPGLLVTLNQRKGRVTNLTFNPYFKPGESAYQLATVSADDQTTKLWELPDLPKLRDLERLVKDLETREGEADKYRIETILKEAESFLPAKRRRLTESEFNDYVKSLESGER
jgi:WD40 repeat protein